MLYSFQYVLENTQRHSLPIMTLYTAYVVVANCSVKKAHTICTLITAADIETENEFI